MHAEVAGVIDEQFDAPGLAATITSRYVILDVGGVERISSFGIRQWVDFIGAITPRMAGIYYVECSPKVVDQFNMVANFGGSGFIVSFYAPYRCDTCDQERRLLFRTDEDTPLWKAGQAPPSMCPTCGNAEDFDEDPAAYFTYVAQQPNAPIPPPVMNSSRETKPSLSASNFWKRSFAASLSDCFSRYSSSVSFILPG